MELQVLLKQVQHCWHFYHFKYGDYIIYCQQKYLRVGFMLSVLTTKKFKNKANKIFVQTNNYL